MIMLTKFNLFGIGVGSDFLSLSVSFSSSLASSAISASGSLILDEGNLLSGIDNCLGTWYKGEYL